MGRGLVWIAVMCVGVVMASPCAFGQLDGLYEFDGGGDGASWDDALNWERVLDAFGIPVSGNPGAPPDAVTSAEVSMLGVVVDGTMPGQTALDLTIGTASGAGSLGVSGGDLTVRDLLVGADALRGGFSGAVTVSGGMLFAADDVLVGQGSPGTMTVSGSGEVGTGDDLIVDDEGMLHVTGGTVRVGDRLTTSGGGSVQVDGGTVRVDDDIYLETGTSSTVTDGLLEVADKLRLLDAARGPVGPGLTINGGIVRSEEYGLEGADLGVIEINGAGVYQVEQASLSVADALMLISDGVHLTTSEAMGLTATTVVVADFFGETDVAFTQIAVLPSPGGAVVLGLAGVAACRRRR